jgi:cephalosporin hydroxylase
LGTHIGYTALILADMIRQGGPGGRLITVEPVAEWHEVARRRMTEAGLDRVVTFLDGYSTSPEVMEAMVGHGPYDLVYVDSSHSRDDTLIELDFLWGQITPGAWIFLHDTSPFSDQWDSAGKGGVRAAIRVWLRDHAEECLYFSCEPPLWPTPYGLGVLRRQIADGS